MSECCKHGRIDRLRAEIARLTAKLAEANARLSDQAEQALAAAREGEETP